MREPAARRRPRPAWLGVLGDVVLLCALFAGALAADLSLLHNAVMGPNLSASARIYSTLMRGVTAAYVALPMDAQPAYLEDLRRYSGGLVREADPADYNVREPLLPARRALLDDVRQSLPDLEVASSPLPDAALWLRMPSAAGDPPGPWLILELPIFSRDLALVFLALVAQVIASAALVMVRARRRLDWATQALREGLPLDGQALAQGETQATADGLQAVKQRFELACSCLSHARQEQEQFLARLVGDMHAAVDVLRRQAQSPGLRLCADRIEWALEGLEKLTLRQEREVACTAHVNEVLAAMPIDPAPGKRHPVRWALGTVPFADVGCDDARRMSSAVFKLLLAGEPASLEVASAYENGWVVVRLTEHGGRTEPGAAAKALMAPCQQAEACGGYMRFRRSPDQAGVQVEILLPPAGTA